MSGWRTASGETETSTSNLISDNGDVARMELAAKYRDDALKVPQNPSRGKSDEASEYRRSSSETQFDKGVVRDQGILASARDAGNGLIIGRNLRETDQVTIPGGMATSIQVAIAMGHLQRNGDGTFSEVAQGAPEDASEGAEGSDGDDGDDSDAPADFTLSEEGETAMTEIVESTDTGTAIRAMDEVITRGEVSENTLAQLASQAGIEPAEMAAKIDAAHQGFYDAAIDHFASRGVINSEALDAFVQDHPQMFAKMAEGARDLVMGRGTGNIDSVADALLERADIYMTDDVVIALEEADFGHRPDGRGGLLVVTNDGAEVPFQVAVKQRIVRFT